MSPVASELDEDEIDELLINTVATVNKLIIRYRILLPPMLSEWYQDQNHWMSLKGFQAL
jgi:hypothetical protein